MDIKLDWCGGMIRFVFIGVVNLRIFVLCCCKVGVIVNWMLELFIIFIYGSEKKKYDEMYILELKIEIL